MISFKNISLFSGAMGLDLGLEKAGFTTMLAVDVSDTVCDTIRANRPHVKILHSNISLLTAKGILREAGMRRGEPDLMSGGPACQAFTTIGKRRSIQDPRGRLVKDFVRIVDGVRPKFFLMENVSGLLSASKDGSREKPGSLFAWLLREFEKSGYLCNWSLLNSADYGVPQIRKRVFVVGNRLGVAFRFPKKTHSASGKRKWKTLRHALRGLKESEKLYTPYSRSLANLFGLIPAGGNWRSLSQHSQKVAMGKAYHAGGGRTAFYRRLSFDRPCPTVLCDPLTRACSFCHPSEIRPLTVAEYARVQQFPDRWRFSGSTSEKYTLIANAVPVSVAKALGLSIRRSLELSRRRSLS
jgi:DNA (cytosine-5)-methyltransferase 1